MAIIVNTLVDSIILLWGSTPLTLREGCTVDSLMCIRLPGLYRFHERFVPLVVVFFSSLSLIVLT
jgi:hypothetical protein